jgi:hypothetical protein
MAMVCAWCFSLGAALCGAVVAAAAAAGPPPLPPRTEVNLHIHWLDKEVGPGTLNARCLDGSPMGYWMRPATAAENKTKYVIYFQGGGWCYTESYCRSRSHGAIGSSKTWKNGSLSCGNFMSGIMSPNASTNWASTWNAVYVPYCDGTSFSSDLAEPLATGGQSPVHYRGRANMQAVLEDLLANRGLSTATSVLIDGGSAGGLTTLIHADRVRSFLPPTTHFGAIGDAGWFRPDPALDLKGYGKSIETMWQVGNCSSDAACEAANPGNTSACGFAAAVFPHLTSSMFVMEGAYDSFQLANIMGFPCSSYGKSLQGCSAAQNASLQAYGAAMRKSIRAGLASTPHHVANSGAFVSSCIIHVQSADNEGHGWDDAAGRYYDRSRWGKDAWNMVDSSPGEAGKSPSEVGAQWFVHGTKAPVAASERVFIQDVPFPGNPSCQLFT